MSLKGGKFNFILLYLLYFVIHKNVLLIPRYINMLLNMTNNNMLKMHGFIVSLKRFVTFQKLNICYKP